MLALKARRVTPTQRVTLEVPALKARRVTLTLKAQRVMRKASLKAQRVMRKARR
ncbi:MAG: hypothetical protein KIT72_11055 [Polyangiaceae bacterium]|nr:hypothetical protein [Polyangiaceae bacterium]MCW5790949.1 hypothetical protein [Polyangiaceae bacterium]